MPEEPGIVGLALQHSLEKLFGNARLVAVILILNGLMLLGAESLRQRAHVDDEERTRAWQRA
jgi:undecaprenyl pyrophosphate phosphatase UppP